MEMIREQISELQKEIKKYENDKKETEDARTNLNRQMKSIDDTIKRYNNSITYKKEVIKELQKAIDYLTIEKQKEYDLMHNQDSQDSQDSSEDFD